MATTSSLSGAAELIESDSSDDGDALPSTRPLHALSALKPLFLKGKDADEGEAQTLHSAANPASSPPRKSEALPPFKSDDGPTTPPPPTAKASVWTAPAISATATAAREAGAVLLETIFSTAALFLLKFAL